MAGIKPVYSGSQRTLGGPYAFSGKAVNSAYAGSGNRITRTAAIPDQVLSVIPAGAILALTAANAAPLSATLVAIPGGTLISLAAEKATPQSATIGTIAAGGITSVEAIIAQSVSLGAIPAGAINNLSALENVTITLDAIPAGSLNNVTAEGEAAPGPLLTNLYDSWGFGSNGDYTGEHNSNTLDTVTSPTWTASGKNGGGIVVADNGGPETNNDYLQVSASSDASLHPNETDMTVAFWVKINSLGRLFALTLSNGGSHGFSIGVYHDGSNWVLKSDRFVFIPFPDATSETQTISNLPATADSSWYHVAIVISLDETAKVYVDGTLSATIADTDLNSYSDDGTDTAIIKFCSDIDATLDELAIWSRALSQSDITSASTSYYSSW
jgi:hypothetical protein